jgi:hypothetical protein
MQQQQDAVELQQQQRQQQQPRITGCELIGNPPCINRDAQTDRGFLERIRLRK